MDEETSSRYQPPIYDNENRHLIGDGKRKRKKKSKDGKGYRSIWFPMKFMSTFENIVPYSPFSHNFSVLFFFDNKKQKKIGAKANPGGTNLGNDKK